MAGTSGYANRLFGPESAGGGGTPDRPLMERLNVLESYYYVVPWQVERIHRFKRFLLDSGAFTALYGAGMDADGLPAYVERYAAFIAEHRIGQYLEMDVDDIVGYQRVREFRAEIERQTGIRCIPVWHLSRGKREYQEMCLEYPYVAIGGIATRDGRKRLKPYLRWFTREAHRLGARVHGLGYTEMRSLGAMGFDSVDSTAWLYGNMGGKVYSFDGSVIRSIPVPKGKRLDTYRAAYHNLEQWARFAEHLEEGDKEW